MAPIARKKHPFRVTGDAPFGRFLADRDIHGAYLRVALVPGGPRDAGNRDGNIRLGVITSYSIHYTKLYDDLVDADEPAADSPINERARAAPAMGIRVEYLVSLDQLAFRLEPVDDRLVLV